MAKQDKLSRRLENIRQSNARKKEHIAASLRTKAEDMLRAAKGLKKAQRKKLRETARQSSDLNAPVEG